MIPDDRIKEFTKGFYPRGKTCCYYNRSVSEDVNTHNVDVEGYIDKLNNGDRNFYYGEYHDNAVLDAMSKVVGESKNIADIGCERGLYPAMALYSGFRNVTVFDIRPIDIQHPNVESFCMSLGPDTEWDGEKFDVVTCLSTLEHCGLGRYGDDLDPWGDFNLVKGIKKILKPDGKLIVSFPIGRGVLCNNLHRIYSKFRRDNMLSGFNLLWKSEFPDKWWDAIRGVYQPIFLYQMITNPSL